MAATAQTQEQETQDATQEKDQGVSIACKVNLETWQKLKYLSLKLSMSEGRNVTISRAVGDVLEKVAADLPAPPDDLVA